MPSPREIAQSVRVFTRKHNSWFKDSIPLIASENVMSPLAREVMNSDLHNRYAEGLPGKRYYQGNIFVDEIESVCESLAKDVFSCRFADVRPTSGTVCNLAVLMALAKPRDKMTTVALSDGGHISHAKIGATGLRGVKTFNYPFDEDAMNIDVAGTKRLIREVKPRIALFGQSVYLFPTPLDEVKEVFDEVGCMTWYDGAHVLGLIAGKRFQDPMRQGMDVVSGSTHKTLPGPQHGVILSDLAKDGLESGLRRGVFPGVTSNHHLHSVAALAVTLAETKEFGEAYADQTVRNAKALALALHSRGMDVLCEKRGFTESHTIVVDVEEFQGGAKVAKALESANIIVNKNLLPWDSNPVRPSGVRMGSQEVTRLGMKEKDMDSVAELIVRVAKGEAPEKVKAEAAALKSSFTKVHYCFFEGEEAYDYPSYDGDL
ncbi:MAG: glycine hydroxymethyltransferase [Candidatus Thermoplasmatota archaeon]|nr:glycine hydroxymethyltransferase [Candidatus Thermoplasmatota archaeon]